MSFIEPLRRNTREEMVQKLFEKSVGFINNHINMSEFKAKWFPNEDRTLALHIIGMESLDTGFVFQGGAVRLIRKVSDVPTISITCTEDTFLRMASAEWSIMEAFYYGELECQGKNFLRDLTIFQTVFDEYGALMKKAKRG